MNKEIEIKYQEILNKKKNDVNCDKEINELISLFDGIIKAIVLDIKKSKCFDDDMNDLMQEGRMGLLSAIDSFNENKAIKFYTYASKCIRNNILDFLRSQNTNGNKALNNPINIDDVLEDLTSNEKTPEDLLIEKETLESIDLALNKTQKEVLNLYNQKCSYAEIAEQLGKTTKAIDNILQQVKRVLKDLN